MRTVVMLAVFMMSVALCYCYSGFFTLCCMVLLLCWVLHCVIARLFVFVLCCMMLLLDCLYLCCVAWCYSYVSCRYAEYFILLLLYWLSLCCVVWWYCYTGSHYAECCSVLLLGWLALWCVLHCAIADYMSLCWVLYCVTVILSVAMPYTYCVY
jgi:hypothetical protein